MNALDVALESLSEVPSDVTLSFSPGPIGKEAAAAKDAAWNKKRLEQGCVPQWTGTQDEDDDGTRGWAIFQTTDAGNADHNAQSVKITSPSGIGTGQNAWSAALNNTRTNTGFFLQSGMQFEEDDTFIGWTDDSIDLEPRRFTKVSYSPSALYYFSNTYTNSRWFMCAGKDEDPDDDRSFNEYECVRSSEATGTHLKRHTDTSVWFENANTNSNWHSGFPATITVSDAKIYRNGTAHAWTTERKLTIHNCHGTVYPVAEAMGSTLKNNGTATWIMSGIPLRCPDEEE